MPKKIYTISGKDWMKGISKQTSSIDGGLFREASNFDPFERTGYLQPSRAATRYANATITKTIKYMAGMDISGPFIIGFASNGTNNALYKINAITGAATDEIASITDSTAARGLLFARNRLLYANPTTVRSVSATLTGDASVLTGLTDGEHPMIVGADLNIYGIDGGTAANNIFKIILATGTTGNSISAFALEPGMLLRDIKNAGRYMVMIADNRNSSSSGIGSYNCMVGYWDYTSGTLTQRYDFTDSAMLSCSVQDDGNVLVKGGDHDYLTNISTFPTPIRPYKGNASITTKPSGAAQVTSKAGKGSVLWGDSNGRIWGYGHQTSGQDRIYYQPYTATLGGVSSIIENAGQVWVATDTPALYGFWEGSTRSTATAYTGPIVFDRPYTITNIKVVTHSVLASGNTMDIELIKQDGGQVISLAQTFSFAADGAKQIKVFGIKPSTNTSPICQEIDQIQIDTNTTVQSLEIWGDEVTDPLYQGI